MWIKMEMGFVITEEVKQEKVGVRAIIAEMQMDTVIGETGEGAMGVAGETQITKSLLLKEFLFCHMYRMG
jgi:hypothetical protein